jgi:hypothetical protein
MSQKIAINTSRTYESGFMLSARAYEYLTKYSDIPEIDRCSAPGVKYRIDHYYRTRRDHPLLIQMIEELGSDAVSDFNSIIKVIEIPDGAKYTIESDRGGYEWIREKSRTWFFK